MKNITIFTLNNILEEKKHEGGKYNAVQPFIQQFCESGFNADLCSEANIPCKQIKQRTFLVTSFEMLQ